MGGRTDATNVIQNTLVAVLASISMDHMGFLGDTLFEIAENKAKIIKPGCMVVSVKQMEEAERAVMERSKKVGCSVVVADADAAVHRKRGLFQQTFDYKEQESVEIALSGEYQFINAVAALEVVEALRKKGYQIPEEAVRSGLKETVWKGRFTVVAREPYVIVDGAHNRDAAKRLRETIEQYLSDKRLIYIMGVLADKEYERVIEETVSFASVRPYASEIVTVMTPDNERALPAEKLAEAVAKYYVPVQAAESIADAVERAYALARKEDVILAFGSLSYLGELIRQVERRTSDD